MDIFQFKQFSVLQGDDVFRISTDAILLGAWTETKGAASILDAGTGTGVIALMLAQRSAGHITGLDILPQAARLAGRNFTASPWHARMDICCGDLKSFRPKEPFDLMVCNPPFFKDGSEAGTLSKDLGRNSRHLTLETLFNAAGSLVPETGQLSLILPATHLRNCIITAQAGGWYAGRRLDVFSKKDRLIRHLIAFNRKSGTCETGQLQIQGAAGRPTEEYIGLCRPYLLNLADVQL